jgi:SAM-dependent methyltransferase
VTAACAFDAALTGRTATLVDSDGAAVGMETRRWRRPADADDAWLLGRCLGPTVDLGCGPGRLLAALVARGVPALGVDHSPVAQAHCRRRGVPMVLGEVWDEVPDEGRWRHVLLADGNVGIGGDPARLLARAARLVGRGGSVLVETDPDPAADWRGTVAVRTAAGLGPAAPWARIGRAALRAVAEQAGLREVAGHDGRRSFAELRT